MARNGLGQWVRGTSGNPGGMPRLPDGLRTKLANLSPRAFDRLAELLDSSDERVRLEAAKTILDRHLGRPAIQADITLHRGAEDAHIAALIEVACRRVLEFGAASALTLYGSGRRRGAGPRLALSVPDASVCVGTSADA